MSNTKLAHTESSPIGVDLVHGYLLTNARGGNKARMKQTRPFATESELTLTSYDMAAMEDRRLRIIRCTTGKLQLKR